MFTTLGLQMSLKWLILTTISIDLGHFKPFYGRLPLIRHLPQQAKFGKTSPSCSAWNSNASSSKNQLHLTNSSRFIGILGCIRALFFYIFWLFYIPPAAASPPTAHSGPGAHREIDGGGERMGGPPPKSVFDRNIHKMIEKQYRACS